MKTKELIVKKALNLISLHGYDGTSIRMICREVGISESSLYNHFAGKKELLGEILGICDRLLRANPSIFGEEQLAETLPLEEILSLLVARYITIWEKPEDVQLWQIISHEQYRNKEIGVLILGETRNRIGWLAAIFDQLQANNKMVACDSEQVAALFIYSIRAQSFDYGLSKLYLPDSSLYVEQLYQSAKLLAKLYEIK